MTFSTPGRFGAVGHAFGRRWSEFSRRRKEHRDLRIVDGLDDTIRRDIGLPPRGERVRHVDFGRS